MTLTIGLTGSIATGKSTISRMFDDFNIPVIDADKISRDVVEPGMEAYKEIINQFGEEVLTDEKTINRATLGDLIFSDEAKRIQLNNIIHPAIRKEMLRQRDELINKQFKSVVLDIPLLFESKLTHLVDKTIVVYADEKVQLERLMKRNNYSEEEALKRIKSQMPVKEKATLSDEVIDNNGSKHDSYIQLESLLKKWHVL
ncbi:dephospho-CoA kinase [Virgibacillus sp. MSJ-26]|uniref:dephospho-CoA kinase n=1 Tax=Virgibacillus sp. MSJ-26 TaxID=2841522 RepID=UPI001C1292AF|nr:dephospho-CoA kinase [Virgibacillus sp. MSJ-26]MBU5468086.1 dephospho-CoA kinase [Virgibacillus sp. MSJ-26]